MTVTRRAPLAPILALCLIPGTIPDAAFGDADERALQVLRSVSTAFAGADALGVSIDSSLLISAAGTDKKVSSNSHVVVRRPNLIHLEQVGDGPAFRIVCDGTDTFTYVPDLKVFNRAEAPKTVKAFFASGVGNPMASTPFAAVPFQTFYSAEDPFAYLTENARSIEFAGEEEVEGVPCSRIKLTYEAGPIDMWFEKGPVPFPRKAVPDLGAMVEELVSRSPQMEGLKIEMTVRFSDWDLDPSGAEALFVFTPPEGAREVSSFSPQAPRRDPTQLIGKAAPDFTVETLDGETFKLADLRDRHVVILDFWASWCGPCVRALPIVAEVADEYEARGVTFLAVNQQETAETVESFLDSRNLDVEVGLDFSGAVGNLYWVGGIPQTVIVGKDGTVASVDVGMSRNLAEELRAKLDGLIGN